jgi:hypothetical protein
MGGFKDDIFQPGPALFFGKALAKAKIKEHERP